MLLKACLNGARQLGSHPNLPAAPADVATAGAAAVAAGAGAIHVHVRDAAGKESLQVSDLNATLSAVRAACPGTPVGVSTGSWIVPDVEERFGLVNAWEQLPDFASVNSHEDGAAELARLLMERGIGVEAGLWMPEAAEQLVAGGVAGDLFRILIEPRGDTADEALETAVGIEAVPDAHNVAAPRLLHGNRDSTWPLIRAAAQRGYDTRIGLEDSLTLPGGDAASDNAALVTAALNEIRAAGGN